MSLGIVGASAIGIGLLLLLTPELFSNHPKYLVLLAGWGSVSMGLAVFYLIATREGRLVIDGLSNRVTLDFESPKGHTLWIRPFEQFSMIRATQVKDQHGLHNHWKIELVSKDETSIRVGYSLLGTIRKRARDKLANQLSALMRVPIVEA